MARAKELAKQWGQLLYGMTPDQARKENVCVRCKKPPRFKSEAGKREYQLSGMCEYCFDEEFKDE